MMTNFPERFAASAERRCWFERSDAEELLDWLEENGLRFIGMDLAEKQGDGNWVLMADSLDLSRQTDNFEAVRRGREFLREFDGEGRMFEPVWQGRMA